MGADETATVLATRGFVVEFDAFTAARLVQVMQQAFPGIDVRVAHSVDQAHKLLAAGSPDVAIVDCALADVVAEIVQRAPQVCLIVCAGHISDDRIFKALRAGAVGYAVKHDTTAGLAEDIRAMAAGARPLSPGMARRFLQHFAGAARDVLEPDERSVLEGIASGATPQALTQRLGAVVADRIRGAYRKLAGGTA